MVWILGLRHLLCPGSVPRWVPGRTPLWCFQSLLGLWHQNDGNQELKSHSYWIQELHRAPGVSETVTAHLCPRLFDVRVGIWEQKGADLSITAKCVKSQSYREHAEVRLVLVTEKSGWVAKLGAITSLILGLQLWIRLWFQHKKGNVPLPELPWTSHRPRSWLKDEGWCWNSLFCTEGQKLLGFSSVIPVVEVLHFPGMSTEQSNTWSLWFGFISSFCSNGIFDAGLEGMMNCTLRTIQWKHMDMFVMYGHAVCDTDLCRVNKVWIPVWKTLLMDTFLILSAPNRTTRFLGSVISSCGDEDIAELPQQPPRMESRPWHSTVPKVSEAIKEKIRIEECNGHSSSWEKIGFYHWNIRKTSIYTLVSIMAPQMI